MPLLVLLLINNIIIMVVSEVSVVPDTISTNHMISIDKADRLADICRYCVGIVEGYCQIPLDMI
jgi:hypothetical protein